MKLLTAELEERFRQVGRQENGYDALVLARYFTPDSSWTWLATEYDEETRTFFGMVQGHEREMGYFSLDEMESARGPLGLPVERDLYFVEQPLREALKAVPSW